MRELFDLATTPDKTWKPFIFGDHNSTVIEAGYFDAFAEFVASATEAKKAVDVPKTVDQTPMVDSK